MCALRRGRFQRRPEFRITPSARLQEVVNILVDPEATRLREQLQHLVVRNVGMGGTPDGFIHEGILHRAAVSSMPMGLAPLHPALHEEMGLWLMLNTKLSTDTAGIVQGMSPAVTRCDTDQDVRDVLPEFMVSVSETLKELPRTREPAFNIQDVPFKLAQFEKAEELAGYYMANRILH